MPTIHSDLSSASVSASLTNAILHTATRLGLSRGQLLVTCGLSEQQLNDPDARIAFSAQQQLWQHLQEHVPHSEPGLLLGRSLAPGPFSVLSYLLQSSATLAEALNTALRYQRLAGEGGELQLHEDERTLHLIYQPAQAEHTATRTRVLAMLSSWVASAAPWLENFHLLEARFTHAAPDDLRSYHEVFACPLYFSAKHYALVLPRSLCQQPLEQANAPLQQLLRQHAEALLARLPSASLSAQVVKILSAQLAHGEPDRAQLARGLNLSERTLQRRLADEGSSYVQLLTDTRRQLAEQHLRDSQLPAADIALLLGYSEPSVFYRAFRQWTGFTPGEYRLQHTLAQR